MFGVILCYTMKKQRTCYINSEKFKARQANCFTGADLWGGANMKLCHHVLAMSKKISRFSDMSYCSWKKSHICLYE
jgi:hypothetical protein